MGKDNRPPKEERTLRCGDTREDGMRFWCYHNAAPSGEYWVSQSKFEEMKQRDHERYKSRPRKKVKREHRSSRDNRPPPADRTLVRGDAGDDGMVFWEYARTRRGGEHWITRESFSEKRLRRRETHRIYLERRLKDDPDFKLIHNMRSRVRLALKGDIKHSSCADLLGCSVTAARKHIESQFADGMSWNNHGDWHLSLIHISEPTRPY